MEQESSQIHQVQAPVQLCIEQILLLLFLLSRSWIRTNFA